MDQEAMIEFTSNVLEAFAINNNKRIEKGIKLRRQMHEALDNGVEPEGYRMDWVKEGALTVIGILSEVAHNFNSDHPDDKASVNDLLDILATAIGHIKDSAGMKED